MTEKQEIKTVKKPHKKSFRRRIVVMCLVLVVSAIVIPTGFEVYRLLMLSSTTDENIKKAMDEGFDDFSQSLSDSELNEWELFSMMTSQSLESFFYYSGQKLSFMSAYVESECVTSKEKIKPDTLGRFSSLLQGMMDNYTETPMSVILSEEDGKSYRFDVEANKDDEAEIKDPVLCDVSKESWFPEARIKDDQPRAVKSTLVKDDISLVISHTSRKSASEKPGITVTMVFLAQEIQDVEISPYAALPLFVVDEYGNLVFTTIEEGELSKEHLMEGSIWDLNDSLRTLKKDLDGEYIGRTGDFELNGKEYKYIPGMGEIGFSGWQMILLLEDDMFNETVSVFLEKLVGLEKNAESITRRQIKRSVIIEFAIKGLILVVALFIVIFSTKKTLRSIQAVTKKIQGLSHDNMGFEMEKGLETGDEIQVLAESFAEMSGRIRKQVSEIKDLSVREGQTRAELNVATTIQNNMLPKSFPVLDDREDFDVYADMSTAKEVGGDFYDVFMIDKTHLAMVIGDVSGKGVPAALFMAISKALIRNRAMVGGRPGEILKDVNDQLCENNGVELFVTVWLGILDLSDGVLTESNAGHCSPILYRAGGEYEILKRHHDIVMGGISGLDYADDEIGLETGDILFVYTDGLTEARNPEQELYGTQRLLSTLNRAGAPAMEELIKEVRQDVGDFMGSEPPFDDMTIMAMRY